jgi:hypothetical protein
MILKWGHDTIVKKKTLECRLVSKKISNVMLECFILRYLGKMRQTEYFFKHLLTRPSVFAEGRMISQTIKALKLWKRDTMLVISELMKNFSSLTELKVYYGITECDLDGQIYLPESLKKLHLTILIPESGLFMGNSDILRDLVNLEKLSFSAIRGTGRRFALSPKLKENFSRLGNLRTLKLGDNFLQKIDVSWYPHLLSLSQLESLRIVFPCFGTQNCCCCQYKTMRIMEALAEMKSLTSLQTASDCFLDISRYECLTKMYNLQRLSLKVRNDIKFPRISRENHEFEFGARARDKVVEESVVANYFPSLAKFLMRLPKLKTLRVSYYVEEKRSHLTQ